MKWMLLSTMIPMAILIIVLLVFFWHFTNKYNQLSNNLAVSTEYNANYKNSPSVSSTSQFVGGFLYPNLLSKAQILTSGGEQASKTIDMGSSLSIPIVFEYYVESGKSTITKSLYFDLRNSLISDPLHYMIEVTGNYDYTTTGEIYTDIDDIVS